MRLKRREFVQMASLAATGALAAGSEASASVGKPTGADSASTPAVPVQTNNIVMLSLTIWGSCVYVVSNGRKRLDLAFMKKTNVPKDRYNKDQNVAHVPRIELKNATVTNGSVVIENGHLMVPEGKISIDPASLHETATDLEVVWPDDTTKCPADVNNYQISGFAYLPKLKVRNGPKINDWPKRATTVITLTKGKIDAIKPLYEDADISEFELRWSDDTVIYKQVVTDTTLYTVPLNGKTLRLQVGSDIIELTAIDSSKPIALILRAGPAHMPGGLDPQKKLKHFEGTYHLFDPKPKHEKRGALYHVRFCKNPQVEQREGQPFPGDLCPGGVVEL